MSRISSADNGFKIAPLYGLITSVPSFSRAMSVSRTGDRLTSNFSANSASPKWSPGLNTSSRIASRILLTTRNVAFSVSCVLFEFLRGVDWRMVAEFPQRVLDRHWSGQANCTPFYNFACNAPLTRVESHTNIACNRYFVHAELINHGLIQISERMTSILRWSKRPGPIIGKSALAATRDTFRSSWQPSLPGRAGPGRCSLEKNK